MQTREASKEQLGAEIHHNQPERVVASAMYGKKS
jgi:hypothetical protein